MDVVVVEVRGCEYAPLVFAVSARGSECAGRPPERLLACLSTKASAYTAKLPRLLAEYPQAMEFIEVWAVGRAPRFVVDQIARHRHLSLMVSTARHGQPAVYDPLNYPEIMDVLEDLRDSVEEAMRRCMDRLGRAELCNRLLPPIMDERVFILKTNLRQLAHMYCLRRYGGGQRETVVLLERLLDGVRARCQPAAEAVDLYCGRWGYRG